MGRGGFSLIDLLVAIGVMALLVGTLLPALGAARRAAERAACASNVRQLGLGLSSFAFDNDDRLPTSRVGTQGVDDRGARPQDTVVLRYAVGAELSRAGFTDDWDGLGLLFADGLIDAPPVFYCPAYEGEHPLERYQWAFYERNGEIVGNYQYRADAAGARLSDVGAGVSLIAGAMRSQEEYAHGSGHNFFRADLSLGWYADTDGLLFASLPNEATSAEDAALAVHKAWAATDSVTPGRNPSSDRPDSRPEGSDGPTGADMLR